MNPLAGVCTVSPACMSILFCVHEKRNTSLKSTKGQQHHRELLNRNERTETCSRLIKDSFLLLRRVLLFLFMDFKDGYDCRNITEVCSLCFKSDHLKKTDFSSREERNKNAFIFFTLCEVAGGDAAACQRAKE